MSALEKKVIEDSIQNGTIWSFSTSFSALVEIAIFAYLHHIFMAYHFHSLYAFLRAAIFIKEKILMQKGE